MNFSLHDLVLRTTTSTTYTNNIFFKCINVFAYSRAYNNNNNNNSTISTNNTNNNNNNSKYSIIGVFFSRIYTHKNVVQMVFLVLSVSVALKIGCLKWYVSGISTGTEAKHG